MNFAKIFVPSSTRYKLYCKSDVQETADAISRLFDGNDARPKAEGTLEGGEPELSKGTALSLPSTEIEHSPKKPNIRVRGYMLDVTAKDKRNEPRMAYKFEIAQKQNFFSKLMQPRFIGSVVEGQNDIRTVMEIEMRLPYLPVTLINWSANLALFAIFGVIGSYALLPDPTPMGVVFLKITVVPLVFSLLLSGLLRYNIFRASEKITEFLAQKSAATSTKRVDFDRAPEIWKVILSKRTLFTFAGLFCILGYASVLHMKAWNYWVDGKYKESEELCAPVLNLAEYALGKESSGAAGCNYYLAECSRCEGKYEQARQLYQEALAKFRENLLPGNTIIADCLANLGRTEEETGHLDLALSNYLEADGIFERAPNFGPNCDCVGRLKNRIAKVQAKLKNYSKAELAAQRAVTIDRAYREYGGRSVPEDLNDLGVIFFDEQKYDQAKKTLVDSLALKKKNGDPRSEAVTTENLSIVMAKLGDHKTADSLHKQALQKFHQFLGWQNISLASNDADVLYKKILSITKNEYEVPVTDTRAEMLIGGSSRI